MTSSPLSRRSICAFSLALAAGLPSTAGMRVDALSTADDAREDAPSDLSGLPPGVALDRLVHTPKFQIEGNRGVSVSVARWRLSPQAQFDPVLASPVLFIVEAGEMTLEAVGAGVSVLFPNAAGTPARGDTAPIAGDRVVVPQPGSAFTGDGNIGAIRNEGSDELSLLVVAIIDNPTAGEMTAVPVVGTPRP